MSDLVAHITDADFPQAVAQGVTLVDFWAPHCGRGLPLVFLVMDEVHFSDQGNQIRMVLRRK